MLRPDPVGSLLHPRGSLPTAVTQVTQAFAKMTPEPFSIASTQAVVTEELLRLPCFKGKEIRRQLLMGAQPRRAWGTDTLRRPCLGNASRQTITKLEEALKVPLGHPWSPPRSVSSAVARPMLSLPLLMGAPGMLCSAHRSTSKLLGHVPLPADLAVPVETLDLFVLALDSLPGRLPPSALPQCCTDVKTTGLT